MLLTSVIFLSMKENPELLHDLLKKIAETYNLKTLHLDYYGGLFNYFGLNKNANFLQWMVYNLLKVVARRTKKLTRMNNRFFSPYIVFIAEKI